MTDETIRNGFHTVTPYLVAQDADGLIEFVKRVFDATELSRSIGSAGGRHAEVRIGDSMVMIGGGTATGAWNGEPMPAMLYLYMPDVDAVYARALAAGAISLAAPADQPYGERSAGVQDPFGNQWYVGAPIASQAY
jgi:uncharacterized glyoxalase superfamily protein PhnB